MKTNYNSPPLPLLSSPVKLSSPIRTLGCFWFCSLISLQVNPPATSVWYLLHHEAGILREQLTLGSHVSQSWAPQPVLLQRIQLYPVEQGLVGGGAGVQYIGTWSIPSEVNAALASCCPTRHFYLLALRWPTPSTNTEDLILKTRFSVASRSCFILYFGT